MYLIGKFNRDYFDFTSNDNPMSLIGLKDEISREILQKVTEDDEYQVINLITKEYFEPKQNKWVKIEWF